MKRGLVWFKNDLRLHDNEALCQAIAQCDELVFCYCVEEVLFQKLELGFRKAAINRFKFLEESVLNLKENLEFLGGHLIIGFGIASEFIPKIVADYSITSIYGETEYAYEELKLVGAVQDKLPNIDFNFYWGKTLYHRDDIPFKIDSIPLTSKAYRIPTSKESSPRAVFKTPLTLTAIADAKAYEFCAVDCQPLCQVLTRLATATHAAASLAPCIAPSLAVYQPEFHIRASGRDFKADRFGCFHCCYAGRNANHHPRFKKQTLAGYFLNNIFQHHLSNIIVCNNALS